MPRSPRPAPTPRAQRDDRDDTANDIGSVYRRRRDCGRTSMLLLATTSSWRPTSVVPRLDLPVFSGVALQIGRAHVCTPVTNAHLVCRLLLAKQKTKNTI